MDLHLHESGEMYLETILQLKLKNEYVRSIDIANTMNFSKPSVSRAMKLLREAECITIDEKGYIEFTEKGLSIAKNILNRHKVLTQLLMIVGVDQSQAEEDACKIEHVISDETYHKIMKYVEKQS